MKNQTFFFFLKIYTLTGFQKLDYKEKKNERFGINVIFLVYNLRSEWAKMYSDYILLLSISVVFTCATLNTKKHKHNLFNRQLRQTSLHWLNMNEDHDKTIQVSAGGQQRAVHYCGFPLGSGSQSENIQTLSTSCWNGYKFSCCVHACVDECLCVKISFL